MRAIASGSDVRWGLIGPGRIATQFASALKVVDDSCLYAVAGRNKPRAAIFARDHGATVCYGDYRELLNDSDVDAVYIATPHRYHYDLARDCLLAGKPVLCEKPLTVNAHEAHALIELSQERKVFLMEALWTRFLPIYETVNQWLIAGKIGTVKSTTSSFGCEFPRDPLDRVLNHDLAGGALLDIGVYSLSMSQWVFGEEPLSFTIKGGLGATHVDEHNEITLNYTQGRKSTMVCSITKPLSNDFVISGTQGHIRIRPMFWNATEAILVPTNEYGRTRRPISIEEKFRATGLEYEIEAAVECIRNGLIECPGMRHEDTLATMKLMDAMRHDIGLIYDFEQPRFRLAPAFNKALACPQLPARRSG